MTKHKIVAYQVKTRSGSLVIYAMTESPRGTRVYVGSRAIPTDEVPSAELPGAVEDAMRSLQADAG